jgi:hypothetical protein
MEIEASIIYIYIYRHTHTHTYYTGFQTVASIYTLHRFEASITVGVWSCGGPKPTSESMLRVSNLDGDARGYTEVYRGSVKRKPYVQREGVLYFLAPKCLRRGYKL